MADSSSAETSNLSGSNHSTNFSAYTSEVESDSEVNLSEAGLSSRVVFLLDRLKSPTLADIACKIKLLRGFKSDCVLSTSQM